MDDPTERAASLLRRLARTVPASYDLGTPDIGAPQELSELVGLGVQIVPYLLEQAETAEPPVAAYAVSALGRLGDRTLIAPLERVKRRFEAAPDEDPWTYAVIGQCALAILELQKR